MEIEHKIVISIIVPVYKAEKYLRCCIDSILAQTYANWELLLIDDGSPDRCGEICDEYARKDSRVRVFHKENGGVSSARNLGLKKVRGEYVTFVDADDRLYPHALEKFVTYAEQNNLDLVQCCCNRKYIEGQTSGENSDIEDPSSFISKRLLCVCVWGGVYRLPIIRQNHLRFDENIRLGEDQIFIFKYLQHAKRIQRIGSILYYYRDNEASAVHNPKDAYLIASIKAFQDIREKLKFVSGLCDKQILEFFIFLSKSKQTDIKDIRKLLGKTKLQDPSFCTPKVKALYYLFNLSLPLFVRVIRFIDKLHHI